MRVGRVKELGKVNETIVLIYFFVLYLEKRREKVERAVLSYLTALGPRGGRQSFDVISGSPMWSMFQRYCYSCFSSSTVLLRLRQFCQGPWANMVHLHSPFNMILAVKAWPGQLSNLFCSLWYQDSL